MESNPKQIERLARPWIDLAYPRPQAEREAREDQRVAATWRAQGMTKRDVNRALQKLRSVRDLFVVDARGRLRPAPMGPSIIQTKRKNRKER